MPTAEPDAKAASEAAVAVAALAAEPLLHLFLQTIDAV